MKYRIYFFLIVFTVSLLKILFTATSELSLFTEETQYWLWSKHLDWNYYSKPLMIAVYNFLSTSILGDTQVAVRLSAVLFGLGTAWVIFEFTAEACKDQKLALISALFLIVMPFYHLGTFFHTTDSSLIFFWALTYYLVWRGMKEDKLSFWILGGMASAIGVASKSIMLMAIPLLFIYLIIADRGYLVRKEFYLYILLSLAGVVPLVIWNIQNDFVTFKHVGTLGGLAGQKSFSVTNMFKYLGEYVGGQIGFMSVFFLPLMVLAVRKLRKDKDRDLLFVLLPPLCIWFLFIFISLTKRVEVNWPSFAMVTLPVAFAIMLKSASHGWVRYAYYSIIISGILLLLIMKPAPLDAIGFSNVLKPKNDPLSRLAGYRQAGERVSFLVDSLALDTYFIFSDSYHLSSEMAFYVKGNPQTYCINLGRRKNQFDLWPGLSQFEGQGYYGIYVTTDLEDVKVVSDGFREQVMDEVFVYAYRGAIVRRLRIQVFRDYMHIREMNTETY